MSGCPIRVRLQLRRWQPRGGLQPLVPLIPTSGEPSSAAWFGAPRGTLKEHLATMRREERLKDGGNVPSDIKTLRILVYGLNFSPELTGVGKYTGELAKWLDQRGHDVRVVTAPPYYPQWRVLDGFRAAWYERRVEGRMQVW